MPRDMTGTGRWPPVPRYPPLAFYGAVRFSDPELLAKIVATDPYFLTQDNGAGAPIHFATTYCRLDMLHHLLNMGAEINQRDPQGLTPLHRAAFLAHLDGYMELYEYLLSRGADASLATTTFNEYLAPGPKLPVDLACNQKVAQQLLALEQRYAAVSKVREPHPDIGDWWTCYDYGLDTVRGWAKDYKPDYPEDRRRQREQADKDKARSQQKLLRSEFLKVLSERGPDAARALVAEARSRPAIQQLDGAATPASQATPFSAFLFPGQGSQAVGMLAATCEIPAVKHMLSTAQEVLGYDLFAKCTQGPKELLDDTHVAQPALFIAGLAAAYRCDLEDGGAASLSCQAAAGLSLGEYAALVWAGAMSFEDGLQVVKARAEAMSTAAQEGEPHGMLSVVGLTDQDLKQLCSQVLSEMPAPGIVCQIANFLFPQGRVVSGHLAALNRLKELALAAGALKAQTLAVSGAFHTRLMSSARLSLSKALAAIPIKAPRVPVFSNVTGQPFPDDPDQIRDLLARQLCEPVQWESTLQQLVKMGQASPAGCAQLYELGPGQQIKAMVRRLDAPAWKAFRNVAA